MEASPGRRLLHPLGQGSRKRIAVLADKVSRHRHSLRKSQIIIVHDPVPADCTEKVVCLPGDRILFERIPTPRPAPKIVLKNAWEVEQGKLSGNEEPTAEGNLFRN